MSSNFVEIIKKLISVFGRKPARGLPKPPPSAPRLDSATFTHGENAKLTCGAPNPPAVLRPGEKGRGVKILRFYNNLITKQYFNALLLHEDVYSFSSPYCFDKLCSSPFCVPGKYKRRLI
jgi:hypothetical protein